MPSPRLIFELLDLPLFDSAALSSVPHNACHDAIALRTYVLGQECCPKNGASLAFGLR
jgi:hypothetical protein